MVSTWHNNCLSCFFYWLDDNVYNTNPSELIRSPQKRKDKMFNWDRVLTGNKVRRTLRATVSELNLDIDEDTFEKEFTRLFEADNSRPRQEKEITETEIEAVRAASNGDFGPIHLLKKSPKGREDLMRRVHESGLLS